MRKTKHLVKYNPVRDNRETRADMTAGFNSRILENATIDKNGLNIVNDGAARIYDAAGNLVMRIGLLSSGEHGIEAFLPDGTSVEMSTLAFGEKSAYLPNPGNTTTLDTWEDLTYPTAPGVGPVVEGVRVGSSRKARVTLTSTISCVPNLATGASGFMGVLVEGPTTIQPIEKYAGFVILSVGTATVAMSLRSSATFTLKDLEPGEYTFTAKYLSRTAHAGFAEREIIVQPY